MRKDAFFCLPGSCKPSGWLLFPAFLFLICQTSPVYAQQWEILGSEQQVATAASNYTSITMVMEGTAAVPYLIFTEANVAKVKRYSAGGWVQVGNNLSSGTVTYTRLFSDAAGKLYATYIDASKGNRLAVKVYNAAAGIWEPLNADIANLYVSAGSITNSISQYASTNRSSLAFDTSGFPFILFGDGANLTPAVKKFNGTSWESVGGSTVSSDRAIGVSIAMDSTTNTPYIVYSNQATATSTTGNIIVYRFVNNSWEAIPVPNPVSGGSATTGATTAVRHTSIAFNSTWNPVVSYFNTSNSNRATIIQYNKTTASWSYGATVSTRDASNNNLYRDASGNLYSYFTDAITNGSGRSVARVMKQVTGSTSWTELKSPVVTDGIDEPAGSLSLTVAEDSSKPYIAYTKTNTASVVTPVVRRFTSLPPPPPPAADPVVHTPKQMEYLTRGLVAVRSSFTQVYVGWRLLGTDSSSVSFNVYRDGAKLNATPVTGSTNYVDNTSSNGRYTVRPILNNVELTAEPAVDVWTQIYKSIPLQIPPGGITPAGEAYTYNANDCSVGDLDGDGEYEILLKWDPSNSKDNSQSGYTGNVYIDAYKMNGTRLWRIDLGRNIRAGAHYTQFMVYDLDGDGKAEMACRTADGTIDGAGVTIGDPVADYRNTAGYILSGPEFLTIFNGRTGAAMATTNFIPTRGTVTSWGDNYGNRVDRFVSVIAYLDGARPSLVMGRGYYTRLVRAAWDWRDGKLTSRWVFDSNTAGNGAYAGQGNHNMSVGDVDGDGKDEICNGASAINDNGNGLYANGTGHGDALHMTDLDPDRPGQEVWQNHEDPGAYGNFGLEFRDAKTGIPLWGPLMGDNGDIGRSMAADIDPTYKGYEVWGSSGNLYNCKGLQIGTTKPSYNFGIWWDGDLMRELLDGTKLDKWNYVTKSSNRLLTVYNYGNAVENNGTKANPGLTADLLGDWREEMIFRSSDNQNLLLFTTTIPTTYRLTTLMHDPQYRVAVAWQNSAYNQPPYPSYYLGDSMLPPPPPNIYIAGTAQIPLPVKLMSFETSKRGAVARIDWTAVAEINADHYMLEHSADGMVYTELITVQDKGNTGSVNRYTVTDERPFTGINYYRLKQVDKDGGSTYSGVKTIVFDTDNKLTIFPNPSPGKVKLQFKSANTALLLRVSMTDGKLIGESKGTTGDLNDYINRLLPTLKPGLYQVTVIDETDVHTSRMVRQ